MSAKAFALSAKRSEARGHPSEMEAMKWRPSRRGSLQALPMDRALIIVHVHNKREKLMSPRFLAPLWLVVCGCTSVAPLPQTSWVGQAKAVIESHEKLARAGDLQGIMTNIAEDVVALAPDTPLIKGKAAFREVYAGYLKGGTFDFRHDFEGAEIVGETVVVHGVARGNFIPVAGQPAPFANNFVLVLKRQPTGKFQFWRIAFGPSSS
ncbi:MAG TPA: nuclear transport factor 2 family protein [Thermoanaerobaculia bacterium]|nr:nuclear transport factor 2 family protein [Thermoanaerobaculia bacterium]